MRWWMVLSLGLAACSGGDDTDTNGGDTEDTDTNGGCGAPYVPFDASAGDAFEAQVAAHAEIVALAYSGSLTSSDFSTISSLYTSSGIADGVEAVQDDHSYASVPLPGTAMNSIVTNEISRGSGGDANQKAISAATIEITIQRYFALQLYHELTTSQREADGALWQAASDRSWALYGADPSGEPQVGLSATAGARDTDYGLALNDAATGAILDGACELAAGDSSRLADHAEDADAAVMRAFGASIAHEMDVYSENEWVHWWIALNWWKDAFDYAGHLDPAKRDAIQSEFDKGFMDMDTSAVKSDVEAVFAL